MASHAWRRVFICICLFASTIHSFLQSAPPRVRLSSLNLVAVQGVDDANLISQSSSIAQDEISSKSKIKVADLVAGFFSQARENSNNKILVDDGMLAANLKFVNDMRKRGAKLIENIANVPSSREEAWKYTSLRSLFQHSYSPSLLMPQASSSSEAAMSSILSNYIDERCTSSCLVFIDGHYSKEHSNLSSLAGTGVTFTTLGQLDASALPVQSALLEERRVDTAELPRDSFASDTITALNLANSVDGAVLHVPQGVTLEVPVQVVFYSSLEASVQHRVTYPKLTMNIARNAHAKLKQTFVGEGSESEDEGAMVVSSTRVVIDQGGSLKHTYEQDLPLSARHIEVIASDVQGDASYAVSVMQIGSRLGRVNVHILANETAANCTVHGVTLAHTKQSLDLHSSIYHNAKGQTSRQQQRNVIGEQGEAIFKGRIRIPTQAQMTDSDQLCRSLMLGERARLIAMPTLEITADNVVCSHGASVTDLDENSMFYLAARGIDRSEARKLLLRGFVLDLLVGDLVDKKGERRIVDKLTSMNPLVDVNGRDGKNVQRLTSM